MYFIELLVKKFRKKQSQEDEYNPLEEENEEDYEKCEHIFMPIESTGEVLSCRNCGLVVKREELKDINFFRKKSLHD